MHHRTIFISDVHLGTRGSSTDQLLEFLRDNDADTIFLVGDIIDGWRLKKKRFWPQSHNDVVQKLLRKARKGTRIVYIPGNHDEFLRRFMPMAFGNIELVERAEYTLADGKRMLILHGDEFDAVTTNFKALALVGDWAYVTMIWANRHFNALRAKLGLPYWSLSAYLKKSVKEAVNFIGNFEEAVSGECKRLGFDGIISGHIHHAEIRDMNGILYANCGDWVESRTALVEDFAGKLTLYHFGDSLQAVQKEIV